MLGTCFVENRIGVVDVDEDFAADGISWELGQQAVRTGEREMAEFSSGFGGAAGRKEFVVRPEGAVDENGVRARGKFDPLARAARQAGSDEDLFVVLFEEKSDSRFVGRSRAKEIVADVVGIRTAKGDGTAHEGGRIPWILREVAAQASLARK